MQSVLMIVFISEFSSIQCHAIFFFLLVASCIISVFPTVNLSGVQNA